MNKYGINYKNDRLISAVITSNKNILHRELKDRARIYEEGGACLQGIMDEYGILEYGEAFCKIKNQNSEFILNDKYAVTKCPCLHPGDIRKLHFKKYDQLKENTKKYQKLEIFENVIVFPKKGISSLKKEKDLIQMKLQDQILMEICILSCMTKNYVNLKNSNLWIIIV